VNEDSLDGARDETAAGNGRRDLTQLALLDPVRGREPAALEWVRSRAQLEQVLATPGGSPTGRPAGVRRAVGPRRRRWVWAGAAVAGALVALNTTVGLVPSARESAFAAWTAAPQPQSGAQVLDRARACAAAVDAAAAAPHRVAVSVDDVLLSDKRGPGAITLLRLGADVVECQTMREGGGVSYETLTPSPGTGPTSPAAAVVDSIGYAGDEDPATVYSFATGRVGDDVTGIDVVTEDGRTVQASVRQGWWVAWWPGEQSVGPTRGHESEVVVHTAAGETRQDWRDLYVLTSYDLR